VQALGILASTTTTTTTPAGDLDTLSLGKVRV
jgi:hypothetical protein